MLELPLNESIRKFKEIRERRQAGFKAAKAPNQAELLEKLKEIDRQYNEAYKELESNCPDELFYLNDIIEAFNEGNLDEIEALQYITDIYNNRVLKIGNKPDNFLKIIEAEMIIFQNLIEVERRQPIESGLIGKFFRKENKRYLCIRGTKDLQLIIYELHQKSNDPPEPYNSWNNFYKAISGKFYISLSGLKKFQTEPESLPGLSEMEYIELERAFWLVMTKKPL